ncbi:MAG: choline dehydrogenase [Sphingobium sp.]|nr:MAG: choline dehydrogenase [Sphingobium sp.]
MGEWMAFDFIIVGAGSAGSVLAARLSEAADTSVLLLEAGPEDSNLWIHIPIGVAKTIRDGSVNWLYSTEPDAATGNRAIPLPRGKVLGGSSSINGHVVTRGQPEDYDSWAAEGNAGWDYESLLPYFRKSEDAIGFKDPVRGHGGPMTVKRSQGLDELTGLLIEAAGQRGIPYNPDPNSRNVEGIGHTQRAVRGGRRVSAARGYLKHARKRPNLTVVTNARARRILFEGRRATGIEYVVGDQVHTAHANREVILASGAIGTPQLLELSGVGQAKRLKDLGIEVVRDLPGVGENLHDHYLARGAWELTQPISMNERSRGLPLLGQVLKYAFTREGLLANAIAHMIIFTRSTPQVERPDLEVTLTPFTATKATDFKSLDKTPGVFMSCVPLRPKSRGHVHIRSADFNDKPIIQPNYLHHEADQQATVAGLRLIRSLLTAPAFDHCRGDELWPTSDKQSDAELLQYARETGLTIHHVVGSCRMGPADAAEANVVGADLRVHGLDGLRVVDASIMPSIISGHTNFPTIAMAEKAADMIRAANKNHSGQ